MATPDVEMHSSDSDSALPETLGPDTLEARSMVLDVYRNAPDAEATLTWVWVNGRVLLKDDFLTLHQFPLDTLVIPATATNCERTFGSSRKLISPKCNRLSDDIIEDTECLKAWWDPSIIKQLA